MRIKYEEITKEDIRADKKIKEIRKKTGILPSNAFHGGKAFQPLPKDMLKAMEEAAKNQKKKRKVDQFLKPKSRTKTQATTSAASSHGSETATSTDASIQTNASVQTSQRTIAPSEAIYQAFKDLTHATGVGRTVEITEAFGKFIIKLLNLILD